MKKSISISARKDKARRLQKMICEMVSDFLGIPWGPEDDKLIQSRSMGQSGVDVILRGEALDLFPHSIECKWTERWSVHEDIEQAKKNQIEGTDWLLFMKRNHEDPVVILDAKTFFKLRRKE